jgi:hypothetical protein
MPRCSRVVLCAVCASLTVGALSGCATPIESTVSSITAQEDLADIQSNVGATIRDDGNTLAAANDKGHSYSYLNTRGLTNLQQIPFDVSAIVGAGMMAGATANFETAEFRFVHRQTTDGTPEPQTIEVEDENGEMVLREVEAPPAPGQWVALLEYAKITGYNNQTAAVLDSYAELLDRDLERLKAMEETERVIYIQEIKSREAVYGKMLESAAQVAGLIL